MAQVVNPLDQASTYRDSQSRLDAQKTQELLDRSSTLYVSWKPFVLHYRRTDIRPLPKMRFSRGRRGSEANHHGTGPEYTARPIYHFFLHRAVLSDTYRYRTPCGFCFVEYYTHAEAAAAVRYISGTKLDERIVRCDLDLGYREGRQYGRGKSGGQVRDELRQDYDAGRGGWGAQAQRERREEVVYEQQTSAAGGGGDWKHANDNPYKRQREDDDEMEPTPQRMRENDDADTRSGGS
ncbi:unnamed protein product [Rhizoctonia solani]|uniref:Nuclear cap-binding protein subunit 2 n=1 Tax=Rhizoctonia solani TaxID=456999 RepID=A0A8H3HJJ0_9AGAM|nr:unnamed protein product [Rhizoctonia solani]